MSWRKYFSEIGEEFDVIVKEINGPSWNPINYVGRSEPVYIYERTERSIDFTLKLL